MKIAWRIVTVSVFTTLVITLLVLLSVGSRRKRAGTPCQKIEVAVVDSNRLGFVSEKDINRYISESYGNVLGFSIDSIDLKKIETIIGAKSAIKTCEAYTTNDGVLHIEVSQCKPLIRFNTDNGGFYCDEAGYIFPLQHGKEPEVTVIEGNISKTKLGDKTWIESVIELVKIINKDSYWSKSIKLIRAKNNGCIEIVPAGGKEIFVFGLPDDILPKLTKMEDYYSYIKPTKDENYYRLVDVRYNGQIICRQK